MPFEELQPPKPAPFNPDHLVLCSKRHPKNADLYWYKVMVGANLANRLGWEHELSISVQWGSGDDAGKVRLLPRPGGVGTSRIRRSEKTGICTVALGALPQSCAHVDFDRVSLVYKTQPLSTTVSDIKSVVLELPPGFLKAV